MVELFAVGFCVLVSFLFNGFEAALLQLTPATVRARVSEGCGLRVEEIFERRAENLACILLVTNFSHITALALLVTWVRPWFGELSYLLLGLLALPVILFLLGTLPKTLFAPRAHQVLAAGWWMLAGARRLFWPVLWMFHWVLKPLEKDRHQRRAQVGIAREELLFLAQQQTGVSNLVQSRIIKEILNFRKLKVEDMMLPWDRVVAAREHEAIERVIERALRNQLDRFPVIDDAGNVKGLVLTLDLLFDRERGGSVRQHLRHVVSVREGESLFRALRLMRAARVTLAVVLDRNESAVGLLFHEQLIDWLTRGAEGEQRQARDETGA